MQETKLELKVRIKVRVASKQNAVLSLWKNSVHSSLHRKLTPPWYYTPADKKNSLRTHQLYVLLQTGLSNKGRQTTEKEKARVSVSEVELPFILKGKKKKKTYTLKMQCIQRNCTVTTSKAHTVDPRYPHRVNVLSRGTGQLQLIS